MKKHILLLACLAICGCAPAYLAELDSSAALTRQMTTVGTFGPANLSNVVTNVRFLPVKPTATSIAALNVQDGFLITEYAGNDYLQFGYLDSTGQVQLASNVSPFSLASAGSNYPLYQFEATTTTTSANMVVFFFDPSTPPSNLSTYTFVSATLPSGPVTATAPSPLLTSIYSGAYIYGESVMPAPSPAADTFVFLLANGLGGFLPGSASLSGSSFPAFSAPVFNQTLLTLPAGNRFLYYVNQAGTLSYAVDFSGSQWECWQWGPVPLTAPPVKLTGVTHRIDAVLTDGDLLSTEGGILRLYDPNGSPVLSVSLGGLQFCYEAYVGSTAYVFFSLPINLGRGDWMFRVYAMPTSSMRSLGG